MTAASRLHLGEQMRAHMLPIQRKKANSHRKAPCDSRKGFAAVTDKERTNIRASRISSSGSSSTRAMISRSHLIAYTVCNTVITEVSQAWQVTAKSIAEEHP